MSPHAPAIAALARQLLRGYRLTTQERAQETEAMAQVLQTAAEAQLENLEHRKA